MSITYPSSKEEKLIAVIRIMSLLRGDKLRPLDAEYLASFLCLPDKYFYAPFSTQARTRVAEKMQASKQSVNNHVYSLLDNGYLKRDSDNIIQFTKPIKALRNPPNSLTINFDEKRESVHPDTSGSTTDEV